MRMKTKLITVSIPWNLAESVDKATEKYTRSRSNIVRLALENWLNDPKNEEFMAQPIPIRRGWKK